MNNIDYVTFAPRPIQDLSSRHLDDTTVINLCRLYQSNIPENIEIANQIINTLGVSIDDLLEHIINIDIEQGRIIVRNKKKKL